MNETQNLSWTSVTSLSRVFVISMRPNLAVYQRKRTQGICDMVFSALRMESCFSCPLCFLPILIRSGTLSFLWSIPTRSTNRSRRLRKVLDRKGSIWKRTGDETR